MDKNCERKKRCVKNHLMAELGDFAFAWDLEEDDLIELLEEFIEDLGKTDSVNIQIKEILDLLDELKEKFSNEKNS